MTKNLAAAEASPQLPREYPISLTRGAAKYPRSQARARDVETDFEKWRQAHRRTPEAELIAKVASLQAENARLLGSVDAAKRETYQAQLEREQYRAHVHRLARTLQRAHEERALAAHRQVESLRLEYRARDERFRKADRARALLETAKALAKARPGADASDFAAAASALADGHPSQAVRGLAAQFAASLPTTAPVKKTKKKRKSAK